MEAWVRPGIAVGPILFTFDLRKPVPDFHFVNHRFLSPRFLFPPHLTVKKAPFLRYVDGSDREKKVLHPGKEESGTIG